MTIARQLAEIERITQTTRAWSDADLRDWADRVATIIASISSTRYVADLSLVPRLVSCWLAIPEQGPAIERCLLAQRLAELFGWYINESDSFDAAKALAFGARVESLARSCGDSSMLVSALTWRADVLHSLYDFAGATICLEEALLLTRSLGDCSSEARVWNSLGAANQGLGLFDDACLCFERVSSLCAGLPQLRSLRALSFYNIARASLLAKNPERGLNAVKAAVELISTPATETELVSRSLAESVFSQLLIEFDAFALAQTHATAARHFAKLAGAKRAELGCGLGDADVIDPVQPVEDDDSVNFANERAVVGFPSPSLGGAEHAALAAELADGICDAYVIGYGVGLARLRRILPHTRQHPVFVEVLAALAKICERAGLAEDAARYTEQLSHYLTETYALVYPAQNAALADAFARGAAGGTPLTPDVLSRPPLTEDQLSVLQQTHAYERVALTADVSEGVSDEHLYRVGRLSELLGVAAGLDDRSAFVINVAARLHDIGKIAIPDYLLRKTAPLSAGERETLKLHTLFGADTLAALPGQTVLSIAQEIARSHHEHWNGTGFPAGLAGAAIPLSARIVAIADVFDSLRHSPLSARPASIDQALTYIECGASTLFDPSVCSLLRPLISQLQRQYGDVDAFLSADAERSSFVRARRNIAMLQLGNTDNRIYRSSFPS